MASIPMSEAVQGGGSAMKGGTGMAKPKNFMKGAVPPENKGLLHEKLGVKEGETIPMGKLEEAANKAKKTGDSTLAHEVAFAKNAGNASRKNAAAKK